MVVADAGLLENRRAPATTLEGWRAFISADPSELALLARGQWEALGERDRRDYDDARIAHHAELVVVTTSAITEITSEGQLLVLMNQREIGARRGLIVSGDAATGKTTSIKQLGRLHELRVRARFPAGADRIPVVYVTCPPKGSPRKLAMEFARFLGLPLRTRANVTDIADAVCQVLIDARTNLVLVDEIHNLNHGTPAGEDLSDHLKYFTEHLPATFIYAGIDVERCGVFTGTRGRQLAGRCELICTGPFPYRDEWAQLIAALEATLRLHRHEPGTLPAQARYLHQRTGGMIGSLTHLIRGAAIRAILGGQEAITRPLLDSVRIDHAAESATRRDQQHPVTLNPARLARFADWAQHAAAPAAAPHRHPGPRRVLPGLHRPARRRQPPGIPRAHRRPGRPRRGHPGPRPAETAPAGTPRGRGQPAAGPHRPALLGRRRPLPARPRRVPPAAAPGLPPLHRPPGHHRAHRLPPAAAPDPLPPPPALDRPGCPHPRRPARHQPAPRDPQGAAPPPRSAARPPLAGRRGRHQPRHPRHLPGPARRHLDPGPAAAAAPARPRHLGPGPRRGARRLPWPGRRQPRPRHRRDRDIPRRRLARRTHPPGAQHQPPRRVLTHRCPVSAGAADSHCACRWPGESQQERLMSRSVRLRGGKVNRHRRICALPLSGRPQG